MSAAASADQTPPHSGGITPFRGPNQADTRGVRAIALVSDDCPTRVATGTLRVDGSELLMPLEVINTGQIDILGYRLLALVVMPDGTIRDRQPVEVTTRVRAGRRHTTVVRLHTRPTSGEFVVLAVANLVRLDAPCEVARADIEVAAQQTVRSLARQ